MIRKVSSGPHRSQPLAGRDRFYPKGMRPADYLVFYAEHIHPVEVDASQGTKAEKS
jgi:hypothetical protein